MSLSASQPHRQTNRLVQKQRRRFRYAEPESGVSGHPMSSRECVSFVNLATAAGGATSDNRHLHNALSANAERIPA